MAKMIPNNVMIEEFHGSFGEATVYEALKSLPDEYIVFHSVHWNKKNEKGNVIWGESDFTVFHPKIGLIVIEVKSGGIQHLEGRWTQINTVTHEKYKMKDPMVQAERSKFTFADILSSSEENICDYWVETAVWFPSVENGAILGELPPSYNYGNVLTKNDLSNPQRSIERVFDYYKMFPKPFYEKSDVDYVIRALSPKFDAIPSFYNDLQEQDYYFNKMTQEQSYLLDYLEEQRVAAIQGGAGTGKTMLALEKARRLSQNDKVLFLCFNKYLLNYFKNFYGDELSNVEFFNLPSLVCSKMHIGDAGGNDGIVTYLNGYDQYGWQYKHIIIDEGQDFFEEHIEILSTIAEMRDGCFYVFYDKNQLVQQRQSLDWMNYIECRLVLTANCRNTKNIAVTSNKSIGIDKVKLRYDIAGKKPNFYIASSRDELFKNIATLIRFYTDNGIKKKQIVILTVKTEETSALADATSVGSYHISNDPNSNGVLFTSARKFKGLESDVVIIIDVNEETFKNDELRRVLYVGTSRAKHYLDFVTMLNDNQIMEFSEAISGQKSKNAKLIISSILKVKIASNN